MTEEILKKSSDLFYSINLLKKLIIEIESDEYSFIRSIGLRGEDFEDIDMKVDESILDILNVKLTELIDEFENIKS